MAASQQSGSQNPYRRALLRRQQSVDTRRAIVRAAARVWAAKGYDATTVEDICAAAKIGRSTYYFHFESKRQLLSELTWATASGTASDVARTFEAGDLAQQLKAFIDGLARRMESVPRDLAALVLRHAIGGMERLGAYPDGKVDFGLIHTRILERAQSTGEIRADVDAAEIGAILGGMTMEALLRWATGHTGRTPLRNSLALRYDLVVDGIRT
jgi:AcrR family transcriptional regulator